MRHARKLIQEHLSQDLPASKRAWLEAHLRGCTSCREEYDRMAIVLRVAAGREPTRKEMDAWREGIWNRTEGRQAPVPTPLALGLSPVLAAACVFLVAIGVWLLRPDVEQPAVQMRGQARTVQPALELEVFAIRQPTGKETPSIRQVVDGESVGLNELIQFRFRSTSHEIGYVYLLGLDHRLRPLDYFPRPGKTESIALKQGISPGSIRLARRHQPGPLWIVGLFSVRPLERGTAHRWIERATLGGMESVNWGTMQPGSGIAPMIRRIWLVHE